MRTKYILITLTLIVLLAACRQTTKEGQETSNSVDSLNNKKEAVSFSVPDSIDMAKLSKIDFDQYESLQLDSVVRNFDELDVYLGMSYPLESGKLQTVWAISSGEASIYLVSYRDNAMIDYATVAYSDWVEYYSSTTSILMNNELVVQTLEYNYDESEDVERNDTLISQYKISPDLKFVKIN